MAEVSLFLNNEDRRADIDFSQIVLTRRLYRDGNSEYLINNSKVRLSDVQIMLAKANFGQKTYSVIGQGMVEGFLNTTLSERKEFFDEATGVRQFQIKRDDSLNKLLASHENSTQGQMILAEIEPRLKSLTKQVNKLQRRGEIEVELRGLQLAYYRKTWHEINDKFTNYNQKYIQLDKIKLDKEKKLDNLNLKLNQLQKQTSSSQEFNNLQNELAKLQSQKDSIIKQVTRIDAQLEMKLESEGQFDLAWLKNKSEELAKENKDLAEEIKSLEVIINTFRQEENFLINKKEELNRKIKELNASIINNTSSIGDAEIKKINQELKNLFEKLESAENLSEISEVKIILNEIKIDFKKLLVLSGDFSGGVSLEKIHNELISLTDQREEVSNELGQKNSQSFSQVERLKILKEKKSQLSQESFNVENKLKQHQNKLNFGELGKEQDRLKQQLNEIETEAKTVKEKLSLISDREAADRSLLFELQNNIQNLQNELNTINKELNELKINSTRYETRLEDTEMEIRNELKGLSEVKKDRGETHIEIEPLHEKINNLKRQLEHIGGIDPEIEKEYIDTKERFDYLNSQIVDLDQAIISLEKIIKELDGVIKEKFDKEFKIISSKFEEYFKILFNGGTAKIIKVMESDSIMDDDKTEMQVAAEASKEDKIEQIKNDGLKKIKYLQKYNATGLAGIEIQATPPGKKIKSISMLSGGERALTAIALICAIISANPSPFVVLDEVDAALDEANSERLAKILDDLSYKTQFIVITHNRASMRRANVLYGVTMGDDGVSKLLSIKLEDAKSVDKQ